MVDHRHYDIQLRLDENDCEVLFPSKWMALRAIGEIDPQILADHHYEPGLPAKTFDSQSIKAFLLACFASSTVT
jgi:hypothetical protein